MKRECLVGVVGCGYWGPNIVRNLRSLPGCRVKVICDLSESRLAHMRTLYPDVECTTDYHHVLNGAGVDAVVVAASPSHHFALAKAALLAGKHTLVEKPMASSVAECEELVMIAERMGLILMTGHIFLYSAAVRMIAEMVHAGDLGEIRYISARRLNFGSFREDINVAWDLAPHDISIILHILGKHPTAVNCRGNAYVTEGIEDVTNITLSFGSSCFATIQSSWLEPRKVREMIIVGSRRMIVYDDLHQDSVRVYDVGVEGPPFCDLPPSDRHGARCLPLIAREEPLRAECQHFIDCIHNGMVALTCGQHGLDVVRILEACSESLRNAGSQTTVFPSLRYKLTAPFFAWGAGVAETGVTHHG